MVVLMHRTMLHLHEHVFPNVLRQLYRYITCVDQRNLWSLIICHVLFIVVKVVDEDAPPISTQVRVEICRLFTA